MWLPIQKGLWKQHELWDGTYTVSDWLDIIEKIPEFAKDKTQLLEAILGKFNG